MFVYSLNLILLQQLYFCFIVNTESVLIARGRTFNCISVLKISANLSYN